MSTLTDYDKADDWSDILAVENPIAEAKDCGDGISSEQYREQPNGAKRGDAAYVMSGSDLMEFWTCPHRWVNGYKDEGTRSTEWGSLVDCLLMTPDEFEKRYIVVPEEYENEKGELKEWNFNAKVCKEWRQNHGGTREEVKTGFLRDARWAVHLLTQDEQIRDIIQSSRKQVMLTGTYHDKETDVTVPVKALLDLVPPAKFLCDVKTTTNAHKRAWARHVQQFNYHCQAARHLDLWNAANNDTRKTFRHIVQEYFEPFEIAKRELDDTFLSQGRDRYVEALKLYAQCLKTGKWGGYDEPRFNNDVLIDGFLLVSPEAWMVGV